MPSIPHGGSLTQIKEVGKDSPELSGFGPNQQVRIGDEVKTTVANIANGVLSPLGGFMSESDYLSVLDQMRLESDVPWTIPILLLGDQPQGASSGDELL